DWRVIEKSRKAEDVKTLDMKAPVVIKPASGGSSLGVTICKKDEEISPAIDLAFDSGDRVLVENFVDGTLIAVGIIGDKTAPVIEIETNAQFYDYKSKYTSGGSTYHIPARLAPAILEKVKEMALAIHKAIGVVGMSRSEFIVDKSGTGWFLELNTIPGLTGTSLLPKAAKKMGLPFDDLVLHIINEAL
ncbi:D-alanine--D-alanine ligase, partial [hydrothermal vent metagenome]